MSTNTSYQEALDFMFSQLPFFQRIGSAAYKANLDNTIALCLHLNNPERKFKTIHVAGTNGKGSVSHTIAAILQAAGLKVGLYTSPHLKDFRERIKINGAPVSKEFVADFIKRHKEFFLQLQPSFFEMTVGLAFNYFADQQVDIAVIEVGLGGRLDSTNIIQPEAAVITNISYDHINLLGDTLEKIAVEKAGIIKSKIPVIIGETQQETANVFLEKVKEVNAASIVFADQHYQAVKAKQCMEDGRYYLTMDILSGGETKYIGLQSELLGLYQLKNIPTVLAVMDELNKIGYNISQQTIRRGIKQSSSLTGLLGRWQVLSVHPLIIADTAHNVAGIKQVLNQVSQMQYKQLHFVLGMVNDKDINAVLKLLPVNAIYYFCKANIPRGLEADALQAAAAEYELKGNVYASVEEAFKAAKSKAAWSDFILVAGSTFTVAEVV